MSKEGVFFILLCNLKKKKVNFFLKKRRNQQTGFGVGTDRGQGHDRGRPARTRAGAVVPLSSTAATLKLFFSRPPLNGAPRRALVVDAARTFYCRRSAVVSTLKPCHLYTVHFCCSSRRERASLIPLCVRKVPGYYAVVSGLISFFALHCALNCEV